VVVRSGDQEDTNSGASTYTLVTPDGDRIPVDLEVGDRILGFEPDSTHVAYAEPAAGDTWDIVVRDVVTSQELARVGIGGTFTWGGWEAPPVALDGNVVWVHFDDGWTEVTWPEVVVEVSSDTENVYEVANGHFADWNSRRELWTIKEMSDHSTVREIRLDQGWYAFFSPDGRYLQAFPDDVRRIPEVDTKLYDVRTGESRGVPDAAEELGWTPDGHTLEVFSDRVRICEPISGSCRTHTYDFGDGSVKVGGASYES
jgi:hypothetical protein